MNYKLTALSPLLVGDGQKLSPIDYMVWRDQVNVLDQKRIFKLLARGPRLEGYLSQLQRAEKLDFASWGGFAQNYAGRRIPFEHASSTAFWEQTRAEYLHIPTFCSGPAGAFLPASAMKGALRTGVAFARFNEGVIRELASRVGNDRIPRHLGEAAEGMTLGSATNDPMRRILAADSKTINSAAFKIFLLRVSTLESRGDSQELAWKQADRGNAPGRAPEQSTPLFVEMAVAGTSFEGEWSIRETSGQREGSTVERIFAANKEHAAKLLEAHRLYATHARLPRIVDGIDQLASRLENVHARKDACVLNLGWGGGFLSKAAFLDTSNEDYRSLLRRMPVYERAIRSGLPFPKTRRIVFEQNQPASLPGWALLEIS